MSLADIRNACHIAIIAMVLIAMGSAAPRAHAAESYTQSNLGCSTLNWGSGSADASGTNYVSCSNLVVRYSADGRRLPDVLLPGSTDDVAPSPDGAYLYIFFADDVRRMNRQADGSYALDKQWKLAPYVINGISYPVRGRSIAVDAWGDLYISNGAWYPGAPNVILKYAPAGTFKLYFGGWGQAVGEFNTNMGIAVTRDGRSVYTTEQINGRVQRFDWNGRTYAFAATFGSTETSCAGTGLFAAPYDIGIDAWNYLYVMDTSCRRVQKFTSNGMFVGVVAQLPANGWLGHGIAVDLNGNFLAAQWGLQFRRSASNPVPGPYPGIAPLPAPDTTAPVIDTVAVPSITLQQSVTVVISAVDVGTGVASIRLAGEDGVWGAWHSYANTVTHVASAGYGTKGVIVQVRDGAGNESTTVFRTFQYLAEMPVPPDSEAPMLTAVAAPSSTTSASISIAITATDNTAVTQYRIAADDGIWGSWQAYASPVAYTLPGSYGVKGFSLQVRDRAGNESSAIYRQVAFEAPAQIVARDIADPILVSALGPAVTNDQVISVSLEATDDVEVTRVRTAQEDGVWSSWRAFVPTLPVTLSSGHGDKAVFVQVGDAAGRESVIRQLRVRFQADAIVVPEPTDSTSPTLTDAIIPSLSTTQQVPVEMVASDNIGVAQVRFAGEDGNWGPWQAYVASMKHTLSAGYTFKIVSIQVRDAAGNESNVLVRRSQLVMHLPDNGAVDAADPIIRSVQIPSPALARNIQVAVDATDDVSVTQIRLANEDGIWGGWVAFTPQMTHLLSAGNTDKVVFVQVRDAAGRESNVVIARTTLQA